MKNIFVCLMLLIIIFTVKANTAQALKRAIFPDGKMLQPIPQDSHPNISGNINSTTEFIPDRVEPMQNNSTNKEEAGGVITEKQQEKGESSHVIWYIITSIIFILILIIYYKKRKLN